MRKKVYIMRGIPGSGKSTMARKLASDHGGIFAIHSTDSYFMVNGKYQFDGTKLKECHARNLAAFRKSLERDIPLVICDNTNSKHWEYAPYVESAEQFNYEVEIFSITNLSPHIAAKRNTHGVPESAIRRILARWQD